jgi:hypothetical protein
MSTYLVLTEKTTERGTRRLHYRNTRTRVHI